MWICVRSTERDMELVDTADTKAEILSIMYADVCSIYPSKEQFVDDIKYGEADYCDSDFFAWSNYGNVNRDWKCFWV